MNFEDKILVTGAKGLVGSALVEHMRNEGYTNIIELGREDCDLVDSVATRKYFEAQRPDYVFHAAARVYGIMGNMKNKALSFYDNVMINTNVVDAANRVGVKKITVMGTGAVYPYPSPGLPLQENMIFFGEPHAAENSYAHAKRAMLAMLRAYEESYGLEWAYVVSCNLFGPRDKFDVEFGHVVPSLIKKFYDAKRAGGKVVVWGDGSAQRDFMYVKDTARVGLEIMKNINGPTNIGSGTVYRIRDIVEMIAEISNMTDQVVWDAEKPNGQDYRAYDLSKINSIGFNCQYSIRQGLEETWAWYSAQAARAQQ
ncbi:GDP-L-fucose synthase family protein [Chitiniphilus eburneus]|uniref:GDP-L-fucose synthase n=1 Tax=Chitiniphilus eburneus TaxID=2571148 RepID=A0A4U0Q8P3_9NEIS|nr:GDP-L-fucose synthase [Chitiniphilus eburneus]TJZ77280.1 GDP-L-fucose synthase [Chitiniphilus eburneus]